MREVYNEWIKLIFSWHTALETMANVLHIDDIYETSVGSPFDKVVALFQERFNLSDEHMEIFYDMLWSDDHTTHVVTINLFDGTNDTLNVDINEFYNLYIDKEHFN